MCYAYYMDANIYVYAHAASHHASGFVCTYIRIYVWRRHLHMYKLIGVYHICILCHIPVCQVSTEICCQWGAVQDVVEY